MSLQSCLRHWNSHWQGDLIQMEHNSLSDLLLIDMSALSDPSISAKKGEHMDY